MKQVLERRLEFLKLEGLGLSLPEIVKELATKYGVSTRAVYNDSERRPIWQNMLSQFRDIEKAALTYSNKLNYIYLKASSMVLQGSEVSRVPALRVMLEVADRQADLAGVRAVTPLPQNIHLTASWNNKWTPEDEAKAKAITDNLKEYEEIVKEVATRTEEEVKAEVKRRLENGESNT